MEKVELIPRFSGLSSGCDILRPTDTPSDVERFDAFLEYLVTVGFADETESPDKQFCHSHRGVPGRTLPDRSVFDNKLCRRNESPSELVASDILPTAGGTRLGIRREVVPQWRHSYRVDVVAVRVLTTPRSASTRPILSVVVSH